MNRILPSFIACFALTISAHTALACSAKHSSAANSTINVDKIDQSILSKAILAETNAHRCKNKRKALKLDTGLNKAAAIHSDNMAKAKKLSHTLSAGKASKMSQRFKLTKVKLNGHGAENIQNMYKVNIPVGSFGIKNEAACQFTYPGTNDIAPEFTYASMAKRVVATWATSKPHNANLLSKKARRMGADAGFAKGGLLCGTYYLTQTFAG